MAANTLEIGGIAYGKINLGGQDYYQETKPLGKGAFSEVYTLYPAKEDGSIDKDNPQALKVFKKVQGKPWKKTANEVHEEAKQLHTRFPTTVYQLAGNQSETYDRVEEKEALKDAPIVMLMPKFPGQPILSPTGEPHSGLDRLTPLQRLELAALVVQTLMELSVNFTDLKPENILIDIQIDDNGHASFGCYPIDFGGYGRTMMTAAPEWNGFDIQCDFFLVPELNSATLKEMSITENAIILDNKNNAHFVIAGKLDENTVIADTDRQGLELCDRVIQVQDPRSSRIIMEAARKSHYGLGNHDKAMEVYSALSILAPILGEAKVYQYKKKFKRHQTKEMRETPFYLENMKSFLHAIVAKKTDPLLANALHWIILNLEAMQNPDPEQRPCYEEIYKRLVSAILLVKENLTPKRSIFENEESLNVYPSDSDSGVSDPDTSDLEAPDSAEIIRHSQSLAPQERTSVASIQNAPFFSFFTRSLSTIGFAGFSPFNERTSTPNTPQDTPNLNRRKLGVSPGSP